MCVCVCLASTFSLLYTLPGSTDHHQIVYFYAEAHSKPHKGIQVACRGHAHHFLPHFQFSLHGWRDTFCWKSARNVTTHPEIMETTGGRGKPQGGRDRLSWLSVWFMLIIQAFPFTARGLFYSVHFHAMSIVCLLQSINLELSTYTFWKLLSNIYPIVEGSYLLPHSLTQVAAASAAILVYRNIGSPWPP